MVHDEEPGVEYFPEVQVVHIGEAGLLANFPASQLRQAERPACREAEKASSVMYRPEGQSVHEVEAIVEYFPDEQLSHDVLE